MGISSALGSSALLPAGLGFRNMVINGDMRIAQRGTSFTSTGSANNDNTYNLDRWVLLSDGNNTVNVSQSTEVPTGGLNSLAMTVVTANRKFGVAQIIEQQNIVGVQNQTVWLSFKARTSGSSLSNIKAVVLAWTGTADSVTRDVVSAWNADGVTPTWATNWVAENTPSNLGVTNSWGEYRLSALCDASNIRNLAVFIWNDDTSTTANDILYVDDVQLEINNSPTPFERRPTAVELAICKRYYEKSFDYDVAPADGVYSGAYISNIPFTDYWVLAIQWVAFSVEKRRIPDMSWFGSGGKWQANNSDNSWTTFAQAPTSSAQGVMGLKRTGFSMGIHNNGANGYNGVAYSRMVRGDWVASAEL